MSLIGIIEIPKGSSYKYEIDKTTGHLVLDRTLEMHYPYNYGFIPNTLSADGDPIDVFVISESPIHPLARVKLDILGVIEMTDNGVSDEKLVCRLEGSNHPYNDSFSEITYFLKNYKTGVIISSVGGKDRALQLLEEARSRV